MYNVEVIIENIRHGDILEIQKLLNNSTAIVADNVVREVLGHIGNGIALKMITDGKITGVWCSKDMIEYTSLSYFYIDPSMRCTLWVLKFFKIGLEFIDKNKPLLITTKDTTGFNRYVEHVDGDIYSFKGFR